MEEIQYLALTAFPPSLVLISLHVSAGSSGTDPRGTEKQRIVFVYIYHLSFHNTCLILYFLFSKFNIKVSPLFMSFLK